MTQERGVYKRFQYACRHCNGSGWLGPYEQCPWCDGTGG